MIIIIILLSYGTTVVYAVHHSLKRCYAAHTCIIYHNHKITQHKTVSLVLTVRFLPILNHVKEIIIKMMIIINKAITLNTRQCQYPQQRSCLMQNATVRDRRNLMTIQHKETLQYCVNRSNSAKWNVPLSFIKILHKMSTGHYTKALWNCCLDV